MTYSITETTITVTIRQNTNNERDCYVKGADGREAVIDGQERGSFFSCLNNPTEEPDGGLSEEEIDKWWEGATIEATLLLKDWTFYLEGYELVTDPDPTAVQAYLTTS